MTTVRLIALMLFVATQDAAPESEVPVGVPFGTPVEFAPPEVQREVEYLLRGMESGRGELIRGSVKLSGRRQVIRNSDPEHNVDGPLTGLIAFDFETGVVRFDCALPCWMAFVDSDALTQGSIERPRLPKPELQMRTLNSLRTQEFFAWYASMGGTDTNVMLSDPGEPWSGGLDASFHIVDVRSLGMIDYREFSGQPPMYGDRPATHDVATLAPLDAIVRGFLERKPVGLKRDGDLVTITWPFYTMVLDEQQGFTPVSYFSTFGEVQYRSAASWTERNGVWVPVRYMVEEVDNLSEGDTVRISYDLEWSHVNDPIPADLFRFESFPDVEDGAVVIDKRPAEPRSLGIWRDGHIVGNLELQEPRGPISLALILGSVVLLAALIVTWLRGRFAGSKENSLV